ncbi:MAG TPA: DUF4340 domain-containing protein [Azospirillum sp.]|nr:DUF4340 domain-containing protein [Azospirillum sp.]
MRRSSLIALAVVTAGTVAAAIWSSVPPVAEPAAGLLFPGLGSRINDVARLEVVGSGTTVTVARGPSGWTVEQKEGYPADADAVKRTVVALAEATAVEPRTTQSDQYPRIGVEDPQTPGAASTQVTLRGGDGAPLAALILGKSAGEATLYARKAGEAQSWLVKARLGALDADPLRWIDRAPPRIPADRVSSVAIRQPDGGQAGIRRDAPGQPFAAFGLPDGAEANPSVVEETAAVAAMLGLEDVARLDPALFSNAVVTTVRTFDGLLLTVRTARRDGQAWIALDAAAEGEAAAAQAKDWQTRHAGWQYRVFEAVGRDLTRTPADFLATEGAK